MWVFGHLGIGSQLAKPFSHGLPARWLLLGTIAPDLIDKPLYFGAAYVTGRMGADIGLISSTRTFGHTGLLIATFILVAFAKRSRAAGAFALGLATHLLLDGIQDAIGILFYGNSPPSSTMLAALYPFYEGRFADYPFHDLREHAATFGNPTIWIAEIFGLITLVRRYYRPGLFRSLRTSRKSRAGRS